MRFIEFMPLDADRNWTPESVLSGAEIRAAIGAVYPLEPVEREPSATARVYRFADGQGQIGFIDPVSDPFCGDCNRIRLTADGKLRTCLFCLNETDLRTPLRDGCSDDELEAIIRAAVWRKELKHRVNEPGFVQPAADDVRHRRLTDRRVRRDGVERTRSVSSERKLATKRLVSCSSLTLFAFVAGAGTAISPCVLPVLPALLSAGATGGRRRPFGIVLGHALTFTITIVGLSELVDGVGLGDGITRSIAIFALLAFGLAVAHPRDRRPARGPALAPGPLRTQGHRRATGSGPGWRSAAPSASSTRRAQARSSRPSSRSAPPAGRRSSSASGTRPARRSSCSRWPSAAAGSSSACAPAAAARSSSAPSASSWSPPRSRWWPTSTSASRPRSPAISPMRSSTRRRRSRTRGRSRPAWPICGAGPPSRNARTPHARARGHWPSPAATAAEPADDPGLPGVTTPELAKLGPAPEFRGTQRWWNTPGNRPLTLAGLKGRVVLIDFWTYTCINCIRTLPYLKAWNQKYADKGLTIVGVHAPEFAFEKKASNVADAIRQNGLTYPVAQDNDMATWNAWGNQYWPAKYLVDAEGQVRYVHFGEGDYEESEAAIRALLAERGATALGTGAKAKDPIPVSRTQLTPETYLGTARAQGFVPSGPRNGTHSYTAARSEDLDLNAFSLGGTWRADAESATAVSGSTIDADVKAARVYLVLASAGDRARPVQVSVDGRRTRTVSVTRQKLYTLVDLPATGRHTLHLDLPPGVSAFAFTFG